MKDGIIYVLVSGGMESVYMLWKLMKESPYEIRAHHIKLDTPQGRQKAEWIAFNNSIKWLRDNVGKIGISTSEHRHSFDTYIPDYTIITYTAYCLSCEPGVIAVAQGQTPIDNPPSLAFMDRRNHMLAIYKSLTRQNTVPQVFPIFGTTREQILEEMPRELFQLTWSCRTPVQTITNGWEACGKCDVCIPFKDRGIPLNNANFC